MRIRFAVTLAVVLALGGCGDGDGDRKAAADGAGDVKKVAMDGSLPRVTQGRAAPEALSDVTCTRDDEGTWTASGSVSNDSKSAVTFQVTVHIGPADGQGAVARTKRVGTVRGHGSVRFDIGEIETRSPDGPCHVQVRILPA